MGIIMKRERVWILCVVFFCAVLLLVSAAAAGNSATITITGVYNGVKPVAVFTATPTSGNAPLTVNFDSSASTGTAPLTYAWDFGDGGTSTLQKPSHTYSAGTYTATLTVTNKAGSDIVSKDITVTAPPTPPIADFTATQAGCAATAPWTVTFTDTSTGGTPTSWAWDFNNDGKVDSTVKNPLPYKYTKAGTYKVKLTVSNAAGISSLVKSITPGTLKASFTYTPTSPKVGQLVSFTDTSAGIPTSWTWEVKKSGGSYKQFSTEQNPTYNVKLTVTSSCGTKTKEQPITVKCGTVTTGLTASTRLGTAPLTVTFTDQSTESPTGWQWDFDNNGVWDSTEKNPHYTYTKAGTYTVKLKLMNDCSSCTTTKSNYIKVNAASSATSSALPTLGDIVDGIIYSLPA
jgi:PKD repeat protein